MRSNWREHHAIPGPQYRRYGYNDHDPLTSGLRIDDIGPALTQIKTESMRCSKGFNAVAYWHPSIGALYICFEPALPPGSGPGGKGQKKMYLQLRPPRLRSFTMGKNDQKKTALGPKRKTGTKTRHAKSASGIKYQDKSSGQPQLIPVFQAIRTLLLPYAKGSIRLRGGEDGQVVLLVDKPQMIEKRKKTELWFAAALIQKGYVGFYFMPVYMHGALKARLDPELLKCLKGKACFHIKTMDQTLIAQIQAALVLGYDFYKAQGWL